MWSEMLLKIPGLTLRVFGLGFFVLFKVSRLSSRGLEPGSFMFKASGSAIVLTSGDVYLLPSELFFCLPYS